MSRRLPYDKYGSDAQVMSAFLRRRLPERPQGDDRSDEIPEDSVAWRVIEYCWNFDPARRPTCEDVDRYFTQLLEGRRGLLDGEIQISDSAAETPACSYLREDAKTKPGTEPDYSHIYRLLQTVSVLSRDL